MPINAFGVIRKLFNAHGLRLKRNIARGGAMALMVGAVVGCGSAGPTASQKAPSSAVITAVMAKDPTTLDPALNDGTYSDNFVKALFVPLIRFNRNLTMVPAGATSLPTVSNGGKIYTFHLRPGMVFSNGQPVTAADYALNITRILTPSLKSPLIGDFSDIAGARAYIAGKAPSVTGIKVVNPQTLQFSLRQPQRTFLDFIAIHGFPVPPQLVHKYPSTFAYHVVGDGPYVLAGYVPGKQLVLKKNPRYYRASSVKNSEIKVTIGISPQVGVLRVESGQTDVELNPVTGATLLQMLQNPQYKKYVRSAKFVADVYAAMNMTLAPFTNPLVREAAALSVNRQEILRTIYGRGRIMTQIIPYGMPGFDASLKPLPYNPTKAEALLAKAGYPHGKGLPPITFVADTSLPIFNAQHIAEVMQQELQHVGFHVHLQIVTQKGIFRADHSKTPLTLNIVGMNYPDPYTIMWTDFACSQRFFPNWADYCNRQVDQQMASSEQLSLPAAIVVYRQMQQQIEAAYPWIPLFYPKAAYAVNPHVQGVGVNAVQPFDFAAWTKS